MNTARAPATGVDTLVVLMGASRLAEITARVIAAGRAPETPAAVIQSGTCADQRTVYAPLSAIAARAEQEGIGAPALLVIGDVAALGEHLYGALSSLSQSHGIDRDPDWRRSGSSSAAPDSRRGDDTARLAN